MCFMMVYQATSFVFCMPVFQYTFYHFYFLCLALFCMNDDDVDFHNKTKEIMSSPSKTFAKIAFLFSSFLKYFVWILTLNIWNLVGIFHTTIFDVSKHCWFDNWMAFLLSHSDSLKTFNYETMQWIQRENQLSYDMKWNDQITTFKCIVIPTEKIPLLCFMLCAHSRNY